ncbi:hypothetical protein TNIN_345591 [Trichonephila inaurata madagascariensis]|uniref:Uncharacterized protein n=1 Tax=Trichonephila inaurata madagascariensis TaxID=2747483 RepID=A0A8X6XSI4_9ARAC|nr:hypothetical protein TNIN_345591 [Trichonephila inaurata madagascariensis]
MALFVRFEYSVPQVHRKVLSKDLSYILKVSAAINSALISENLAARDVGLLSTLYIADVLSHPNECSSMISIGE